MKLKKILLPLFIVVFAAGLVVLGIAIFSNKDESGFRTRRDILDSHIVELYNEKDDQKKEINTSAKRLVGSYLTEIDDIVNGSYASLGLLVVKNSYDYIGFYSLHSQKWLISPKYVQYSFSYSVQQNSYLGYLLRINYNNVVTIYDSLSNVVYEGNSTDEVIFDTTYVNDSLYLVVEYTQFGLKNTKVYEYQEDGRIKEVLEVPTVSNNDDKEDELEFNEGSLYGNFVKLEKYGLKGYLAYSYNSNLLTIYNEDFEVKFSFTIPEEAGTGAIIGKKIYYQIAHELPEDAEDYDVFVDGGKYNLETYSINLKNGREKEEKLNCVLVDSEGIYDEDEEKSYSLVGICHINEDKTVNSEPKTYIFDQKGNMRDDITEIAIDSFEKVGKNYYNTKTKILYNEDLEIISYLSNLSSLDYKHGYFIGSDSEGKYGILDYNGIVRVKFEYDSIYNTVVNDCVIAIKDGEYYRINISGGTSSKLEGKITKAADNLFVIINNGFMDFVTTDGTKLYTTYENNATYYTTYSLITSLYDGAKYFVISTSCDSSASVDTITYVTICINDIPGMENFVTEGRR